MNNELTELPCSTFLRDGESETMTVAENIGHKYDQSVVVMDCLYWFV
jgi:hypothetical protein